ncbi:hypothetical protein [Mycobacterium sp. SP-6446]|uniref:hypothetical protein n=1 Tax=Mycobacterium sp. SP-6446 TaxID=1834162 RepID=UPI0009F965C5|nr:hypothetical protein [Mycobacterium sp. SP-6446]
MDKAQAAAANDPVIAEATLRVMHFVDPPARLLQPALLMRLVAANRRPRKPHAHSDSEAQPDPEVRGA